MNINILKMALRNFKAVFLLSIRVFSDVTESLNIDGSDSNTRLCGPGGVKRDDIEYLLGEVK